MLWFFVNRVGTTSVLTVVGRLFSVSIAHIVISQQILWEQYQIEKKLHKSNLKTNEDLSRLFQMGENHDSR